LQRLEKYSTLFLQQLKLIQKVFTKNGTFSITIVDLKVEATTSTFKSTIVLEK
jgi:hypothetical protein